MLNSSLPRIEVTLLKTGETFHDLKHQEGCYEDWFSRLFGERVDWQIVDAPYGDTLPPPESVNALLITGSPVSIYERLDWSVACSHWLAKVWEQKIPMLGICYGHQLMADALGGEVAASPKGREMGAVTVKQSSADPLFKGLQEHFEVWQTHIDEVIRAPKMAEVIASNEHCPIQAMAIGDHCRTVQWHPEMNQAIMAHYVRARCASIDDAWGLGAAESLLHSLPTSVSSGRLIAQNFINSWLL